MSSATDYLVSHNMLDDARRLFEGYQLNDFERCFYDCYGFPFRFIAGKDSCDHFVFDFLKRYYKNDFYIRYSFFDKILSKKKAISFFEMPIGSSRVDLASINGSSVAYEIKTEYDSFARLDKQIEDYSKVFEYIYVICPKKNVSIIEKLIPDHCGIYSYDSNRTNPAFIIYRHAKMSPCLNSPVMLGLMLREELVDCFGGFDVSTIIESHTDSEISVALKAALKKRFKNKMQLIKQKTELLTGKL